jgi:hypothetical protein
MTGHHHRRVRLFSSVELFDALELEKASGKAGQIAHRLTFSASGGALLRVPQSG